MKSFYHWGINGKKLFAWVNSANKWEQIAKIEHERLVRQLLRYSQYAQDVESIMDKVVAKSMTDKQAIDEIGKLTYAMIGDTSGSKITISCPKAE